MTSGGNHPFMMSTKMGGGEVQPEVDACGQGEGRRQSHYDVQKKIIFLVLLLHFTRWCTSRFGVRW